MFVVDTTGSMRRELADLQANLVGIIRMLSRLASSLRIGFVAFKDRGEVYLTKVYPLERMNDAHAAELVGFVNGLSAEGGGDDPEPVDEALKAALAMPWRADAQGRIIVIGDAPCACAPARADPGARRAVPPLVAGPAGAAHGIGDLHRREPGAAALLRAPGRGRRRRPVGPSGADGRERVAVGAQRCVAATMP